MMDAQILATNLESGNAVDVFGVWIPRRADNVRLTVEVVHNYFTDLAVEVLERNYDEVGNGSSTGVSVSFVETAGRQTMEVLGSKELIRFKLSLVAGGSLPGGDVGIVVFRFLEPVWFESVEV